MKYFDEGTSQGSYIQDAFICQIYHRLAQITFTTFLVLILCPIFSVAETETIEPANPEHDYGLVYTRLDRNWQSWDGGPTLGCKFADPEVRDPVTGRRCWRGWDMYNKGPAEVNEPLFSFAANGDMMYLSPGGVEHVLWECQEVAPSMPCSALDGMPNWSGNRIWFAVYESKSVQTAGKGPRHPDTPQGQSNYYPGSRILCPSQGSTRGGCNNILPKYSPPGAQNGATIYSVDISDPENPGEPQIFRPREPNTWRVNPVEVCIAKPCEEPFNNKVLHLSNENGRFRVPAPGLNPENFPTLELWIADIDGSNPKFIGDQHGAGRAMHMFQCPDGYVYYSFDQNYGFFPFNGSNRSASRGLGTDGNHQRLARMFPDGSSWEAVLGWHDNKGTPLMTALHFGGCIAGGGPNGRPVVAITNYYRGNNNGMGNLFIGEVQAPGIEGQHPAFGRAQMGQKGSTYGDTKNNWWPLNYIAWPAWAGGGDTPSRRFPNNQKGSTDPFSGKFRSPWALPGGKFFMFTFGKGACKTGAKFNSTDSYPKKNSEDPSGFWWQKTEPGVCHMFLAKARVPSFENRNKEPTPSEISIVRKKKKYHFIDGRPVLNGDTLFGTVKPILKKPSSTAPNTCYFSSRNARLAEATAAARYNNGTGDQLGDDDYTQWNPLPGERGIAGFEKGGRELFSSLQDKETNSQGLRESKGIRQLKFYKVQNNLRPGARYSGKKGDAFRANGQLPLIYLGSAPIQTSDGSISVEIPCETSFIHAGATQDGYAINKTDVPLALRRGINSFNGEDRQCKGCHLHSSQFQPVALEWNSPGNEFLEKGLKRTAISDRGNRAIQYNSDVLPILNRRCGACHSSEAARSGRVTPYFNIPGMKCNADKPTASCEKPTMFATDPSKMSSHFALCGDYAQAVVPLLQRPADTGHKKGDNILTWPWASRWVNAIYPAESPLMWALVNRRLDGRKNTDFGADFDYQKRDAHAPSNTDISSAEVSLIRDWIFTGCFDDESNLNPEGNIYAY